MNGEQSIHRPRVGGDRHIIEVCLAAALQVACYKICTVRLNLPQGGSSDLDGEDSATTSLAAVSSPRVRLVSLTSREELVLHAYGQHRSGLKLPDSILVGCRVSSSSGNSLLLRSVEHIIIAVKSDGIADCMTCSYLLAYQAGTAPALSPLDLQRKRSLERIRADQRAAAAGSAMPAALMRLTSAERRDILAGSPAGSALGQPVAASGIPGSRRGSLLATVPSEVGHSDAEVTVPVQMASMLPGNPTHAASQRHSVDLKVLKQVVKCLNAPAQAKLHASAGGGAAARGARRAGGGRIDVAAAGPQRRERGDVPVRGRRRCGDGARAGSAALGGARPRRRGGPGVHVGGGVRVDLT